ncbi:MAG: hypothetical protein ISR99_01845 [Parcubacteria group bacterium]|nr:hypothetical protein [Parcubacteria group bacterium]
MSEEKNDSGDEVFRAPRFTRQLLDGEWGHIRSNGFSISARRGPDGTIISNSSGPIEDDPEVRKALRIGDGLVNSS